MTVHESESARRPIQSLFACRRGATMLSYVTTLGVVALTGAVAFAEFDDTIRSGIRSEMDAVAEAHGEASDGPVGSLGTEVAVAGAEQLVVQGSWALSQKAGVSGVAAARKKHRGRGSTGSGNGPGIRPGNGGANPPGRDRGGPPGDEPSSGGTCRNGVCSAEDGTTCFAAGTPVATPSGPMPIEELAPGDLVLSRDEVTGGFSTQRVSATHVTLNRSLIDVHTRSSAGEAAALRVTPEHPFWTLSDGWVPAGELVEGDALADTTGAEVSVVDVTDVSQRAPVYNLEVEATHTYFAGATHVWVHNGCFGSKPQPEPAPAPSGPDPFPGAPASNPFTGRNTTVGGEPVQFSPVVVQSGPAAISETGAQQPNGRPMSNIGVDFNGASRDGYYLHWQPGGQVQVTLDATYNRFATATCTGCAVRIETDPATGNVTVTHYNRQRPVDLAPTDFPPQYNELMGPDHGNPNVQWVLPGRDYVGPAVVTGERNAAGGWDFQIRARA